MSTTRSLGGKARSHIRSNVIAYLALFCALTGSAIALPGKNSVRSDDIAKGQVKRVDIRPGAVDGSRVSDDSLTGADINESSLSIQVPSNAAPSGPAGGSLAGSYPNPTLAPDSVGSGQVTDGSLTGADIDETTLAGVPKIVGTGYVSGPGPLVPGACNSVGSPIAGLAFGDSVIITPPASLPNSAVVNGFVDPNSGLAGYKVCNEGEANFPSGSGDYRVLVLR